MSPVDRDDRGIVRCGYCRKTLIAEELKDHKCSTLHLDPKKVRGIVDAVYTFKVRIDGRDLLCVVDAAGTTYRFWVPVEKEAGRLSRLRLRLGDHGTAP